MDKETTTDINEDTTITDFRQTFMTDAGKRTLGNMLIEAKFFNYIKTPEEQAVANFMKTILHKCGVYRVENAPDYVEKILTMKVYEV